MNEKQLLYRRQFIATKKPVAVPTDWTVSRFDDLYVHAHPELSLSTAAETHVNVLILGEIFDPYNIEFENEDIAKKLAADLNDYSDFESRSKSLSGRWLCFVSIGDESRIYPDALSTHTIFYTENRNNKEDFSLGTQPGLLAEYCGIKKDENLIRKYDEYTWMGWWPGELTPYKHVKKLLANHYIDLKDISVHRFWPTKNIASISLGEAAIKIADLTRLTIAAIAHRSPIYISLTAGWDSRMLFACCDFDNPRINFLNRRFPLMDYHDISIPEKLVKQANSNLKILQVNDRDLEGIDVLEFYKKNTGYMMWQELSLIHSANKQLTDDFVILGGHGGESFRLVIGGVQFQKFHNEGKLVPSHYADFAGFGDITPVVEELSRWYDSNLPKGINIYPPVLVDNEYLMGNWATSLSTAANTFNSSFTPFNSLEMFEIGFGVDIKHRMHPYALSREICRAGAPWVLDYPVNTSLRTELKHFIRRYGKYLPWRFQHFIKKKFTELSWSANGLKGHSKYLKDFPPKIAEIMKTVK